MISRSARAVLCAALAASLIPSHALQVPKEVRRLPKPQVAMHCALQMVNLAVLAQREPTGEEDEAVQYSARLFALAATWLPHAKGVSLEEQDRLGHAVVNQPFSKLRPRAAYCAEEGQAMLKELPAERRAELGRHGGIQAVRLQTEIRAGR